MIKCEHCLLEFPEKRAVFDDLNGRKIVFCCHGCRGIYRLINEEELGEFYSLVLNHTPERVPVGPFCMSQAVGCNRLLFGRESFEIRRPPVSHFGAVLSLKEYAANTYPEMFTGDLIHN